MRKLLAIVVALVALVLGLAATRPNRFDVRRSATIQAPPEKVFALINDFHRWGAWLQYERLDPAMKRTLSGAPSGPGAVYAWEGNGKVGVGRMEITEALPASRVAVKLDFVKPMVMGLVFNLDRMIGQELETGLANLKAAAEA